MSSSPETAADVDARLERLYDALVEDEDARVCRDIPEEACRVQPESFFLYVVSLVLTKLGDALASPKTTLTWVMSAAGAPAALTGFLVPIRESGSLLPQIAIAGAIRRMPVRKWVWVGGSVGQGIAIGGFGAAALLLEGAAAGWTMLGLMTLFALSRGFSSVASKDVKGKTIAKTRRGRASGLASSVSGVLTLGVALGLWWSKREGGGDEDLYAWLLVAAGFLWGVAAVVWSRIREQPGATEGGDNALEEALASLSVLRDDPDFRWFVLTRSLLVSTALVAPYVVLLARENLEGRGELLALLILAQGLASSLSAAFWGRWADSSSRKVLVASALLAAGLGVALVVASGVPALGDSMGLYLGAYFVLGIAHSGVRMGRKTHLVDMADGTRRTDYVAVSNTVIGVVLLLVGALGAGSAAFLDPRGVVLLYSLLALAGGLCALRLAEVQVAAGPRRTNEP